MPLQIALIGSTGEAWQHLAACVHSQRVSTVALAVPDSEAAGRLRRRYGIIKRHVSDYRELLDDDALSLVDVCLPPAEQEAAVLAALAAGKHVLCRAPLAKTLAGAEAMLQAARESGTRLFCVLYQRFIPAHLRLPALLADEAIGVPQLGSVSVVLPSGDDDALWAEACHALDFLQHSIAPATSVAAICRGDQATLLSLELGEQALGQVTLLAGADAPRAVTERRLIGARGTIVVRDNPEDELPLVVLQGDEFFPIRLKCPPDVHEYAIIAALEHFLQCLETGQPESVTATEAVAALRVVLAAQESARTACTVKL